jgi:hypothetical protein
MNRSAPPAYFEPRRCFSHDALEGGVSHACGNHQITVKWCARKRECPRVSFRIRFRWAEQSQIDGLARLILETGRLGEVEGHGAFSNVFAFLKPGMNRGGDRHITSWGRLA